MIDAEFTCRCGTGLRRVATPGGRIRLLEVTPTPEGNHHITHTPAGGLRATPITGRDGGPVPAGERHSLHLCPAPAPLCKRPGCRQPMDRELALLESWETHPSCDHEIQEWQRIDRMQRTVKKPRKVYR